MSVKFWLPKVNVLTLRWSRDTKSLGSCLGKYNTHAHTHIYTHTIHTIPTLWLLRQRWWWQLVLRRPFYFSPLKFWALANTSLPPAQEPVNQSHHHGDTSLSLSHLALFLFLAGLYKKCKWRVSDLHQCYGSLIFFFFALLMLLMFPSMLYLSAQAERAV